MTALFQDMSNHFQGASHFLLSPTFLFFAAMYHKLVNKHTLKMTTETNWSSVPATIQRLAYVSNKLAILLPFLFARVSW